MKTLKERIKELPNPFQEQCYYLFGSNSIDNTPVGTVRSVYIKAENIIKGYEALARKYSLVESGLDEFNDLEKLAAEILLQQGS